MGTTVVPEPTACGGVKLKLPRLLLVLHSNQAVVGELLGLTFPMRVAVVPETVAPPVSTVACSLGHEGSIGAHG